MTTDTIKWIEIDWKVLDTINDNRSIIGSTEVGIQLAPTSSIAERLWCVSPAAHGLCAAEGNSTLDSSNAGGFSPLMLLLVAGDDTICFSLALGVPAIFWSLADWLWGVVACFFSSLVMMTRFSS
jgi:hypothetical protein